MKKQRLVRNAVSIDKVEDTSQGIRVGGYIQLWGEQNLNYERYDDTSFDKFITEYFGKEKRNIPVMVMHGWRVEDIAGKIVELTKDKTGIYAVVEISKSAVHYESIAGLVQDGILQGFSTEGNATDYSIEGENEDWHYQVHEMVLLSVSLVTTPAANVGIYVTNATKLVGFGTAENENILKSLGL